LALRASPVSRGAINPIFAAWNATRKNAASPALRLKNLQQEKLKTV
jgi:hypothetical protein